MFEESLSTKTMTKSHRLEKRDIKTKKGFKEKNNFKNSAICFLSNLRKGVVPLK